MEVKTAEQIAQWVIDNRYSKGEGQTIHSFEIYHQIKDDINSIVLSKNTEIDALKAELRRWETGELNTEL